MHIEEGFLLSRARTYPKFRRKPFELNEMGAPDKELVKSGRMNPKGMPVLYLASSIESAISEVKPWSGATVAVGKLVINRPAKLLDLSKNSNTSDYGDAPALYLHNSLSESAFFGQLSSAAHPDDDLAYISTQFIADLIKAHDYDGIVFLSSQIRGEKNYVFFDPKIADCIEIKNFKICSVRYQHQDSLMLGNSVF